ncbi:hypothetical protein O1M54_06985 [Streptomyces diastatochromogenes]|nr:hypothetical protein [Streptomyces diastatochromogenes]
MTATAGPAARRDATGPVRPPAAGRLGWVPEAFAAFFAALGLLCALIAVFAPLRLLLRPVVHTLDLLLVPISANLAYAVFLFLLAAATGARKKVAWWLVVVYLGLVVVSDILGVALGQYTESVPSLVLCGLLLLLLVTARKEFYAASRRGAVWRALGVLLAGLAVAILAGWGWSRCSRAPSRRASTWPGRPTGCASGWRPTASSPAARPARSPSCSACSARSPC